MTTPICDFVRQYAKTRPIRLHMPGHKGRGPLGAERWDITEIDGADDLFAPAGVIEQSEQNAGALFVAISIYSMVCFLFCFQLYGRQRNSTRIVALVFGVIKSRSKNFLPLTFAFHCATT